MRYRLTCAVEGSLFLVDSLTTTYDFEGVRYELIANETRRVTTKLPRLLKCPPRNEEKLARALSEPLMAGARSRQWFALKRTRRFTKH